MHLSPLLPDVVSRGYSPGVSYQTANYINQDQILTFTFDHRMLRTRLPVRSALFKQHTGGLVVRWVTTGESPLLNVFLSILQATQIMFLHVK
jgi:hypothetical protein